MRYSLSNIIRNLIACSGLMLLYAPSVCFAVGSEANSPTSTSTLSSLFSMQRELDNLDKTNDVLGQRLTVVTDWVDVLDKTKGEIGTAALPKNIDTELEKLKAELIKLTPSSPPSTSPNGADQNLIALKNRVQLFFKGIYFSIYNPLDAAEGYFSSSNGGSAADPNGLSRLADDLRRDFRNAIEHQVLNEVDDKLMVYAKDATYDDIKDALSKFPDAASLTSFFSDVTSKELSVIKAQRDSAAKKAAQLSSDIAANKAKAEKLNAQLGSSQETLDQTLVKWVMPFFALVVILLLAIPAIYRKDGVQESIFTTGTLVELITIFLLISSILILGFADKLPKDALGTLLGGISGYVLGRSGQMKQLQSGGAGSGAGKG